MLVLDCRDKLTLEDGSTCVYWKNRGGFGNNRFPHFDLYDSSGALLVKFRVTGIFSPYLSFTDAEGRELATIRFKWSLPILLLPDGTKTELRFFRHSGTDFCTRAEADILGSTLLYTDGVFSIRDDIEAGKLGLVKAVICFCLLYIKVRENDFAWVDHDARFLWLACGVVFLYHIIFVE